MEDERIIARLQSIAEGVTRLAKSIEYQSPNIADKVCSIGA